MFSVSAYEAPIESVCSVMAGACTLKRVCGAGIGLVLKR